jgi:hypothetical protein
MTALFAQMNRQPAPAAPDAGMLAGFFCFYGVILVVALGIHILFLLSLSKCFSQISKRNRLMEPGLVWLNLIPLFNLVWMVITILRLADSLRNEYEDRGLQGDGDFGKTLGILYFVLSFVCGPVGLVCFIMYWVKIVGYTSEMRQSGRGRRRRDEDDEDDDGPQRNRQLDDEDDDDRPRKPRRRDDDAL